MSDKISYTRLGGIKRIIRLGKEWQTSHPEIAALVRGGKTAPQIVRELGLTEIYEIKEKTACVAIYKYLQGHDGQFNVPAYAGVLPAEETARILATNRSSNGKRNGLRVYKEGKGLFARTREQHREAGRKAGKKATLSKGETPWEEIELAALYRIAAEPESRHAQGIYQGKYNPRRIIARLVQEGYSERTKHAVQTKLYAHNRSLESRAEESP